jgi:serine/threonine-protein kinase
MSPEAIQGADVDARTDIYSLGILLYEMLTGRVPFVNDTEYSLMMAQINEPPPTPRTFAPHIPIHIEHAIMRALAKRPEDRFQSVKDFRRALEQNVPVHAPAVETGRPGPTRVAPGGPPVNAPRAGIGVKETRLGGVSADAVMGAARVAAPPATRLTDSEVSRSTGPDRAEYGSQRGATSGSFLDRLSWMHYAGAAVALFVVVGVFVVVIAGIIWTRPGVQTEGPAPAKPAADIPSSAGVQSSQPQEKPSEQPAASASPETPKVGSISPIVVPPQNTGSSDDRGSRTTSTRPAQKKVDPAAAERARRAAEARRLLRQQ